MKMASTCIHLTKEGRAGGNSIILKSSLLGKFMECAIIYSSYSHCKSKFEGGGRRILQADNFRMF